MKTPKEIKIGTFKMSPENVVYFKNMTRKHNNLTFRFLIEEEIRNIFNVLNTECPDLSKLEIKDMMDFLDECVEKYGSKK